METTAPASAPGLTPPPLLLEVAVVFAWQVNVGQALQDLLICMQFWSVEQAQAGGELGQVTHCLGSKNMI